MTNVDISVDFVPQKLKAYSRNEAFMNITVRNTNESQSYWCEGDVSLTSPLSLAHDSELNAGRTRIGIVKPGCSSTKQIKLYTRPNNFPDEYKISLVVYAYDEDGAISERIEKKVGIVCAQEYAQEQSGVKK